MLTLGVPAIVVCLMLMKAPLLAALLPPGAVYVALKQPIGPAWLIGPIFVGIATVLLARSAAKNCVRDLRGWYEHNQGRKTLD
jgi:hypothetical protein